MARAAPRQSRCAHSRRAALLQRWENSCQAAGGVHLIKTVLRWHTAWPCPHLRRLLLCASRHSAGRPAYVAGPACAAHVHLAASLAASLSCHQLQRHT